jgi:hypothetical protein
MPARADGTPVLRLSPGARRSATRSEALLEDHQPAAHHKTNALKQLTPNPIAAPSQPPMSAAPAITTAKIASCTRGFASVAGTRECPSLDIITPRGLTGGNTSVCCCRTRFGGQVCPPGDLATMLPLGLGCDARCDVGVSELKPGVSRPTSIDPPGIDVVQDDRRYQFLPGGWRERRLWMPKNYAHHIGLELDDHRNGRAQLALLPSRNELSEHAQNRAPHARVCVPEQGEKFIEVLA